MNQIKKDLLIGAGIDVDNALERFMGNESLLERMLKKFLTDDNFQKLISAADAKNEDESLHLSHTLKGMCGNLSMTQLYSLFDRQVKLFRSGQASEAFAMMPEIFDVYTSVVDVIKKLD